MAAFDKLMKKLNSLKKPIHLFSVLFKKLFKFKCVGWQKEEKENKLGQFANNHREDTYPEELSGLVLSTFTCMVNFPFIL